MHRPLHTQDSHSRSEAVSAAENPGGLPSICQPLHHKSSIKELYAPGHVGSLEVTHMPDRPASCCNTYTQCLRDCTC